MYYPQNPKIAHLILAAGSSTRMGEPKQLLPWGETTLIGHAIVQSLELKEITTHVVLGANYDLIHKRINQFPITIIRNPNWQTGMGSSIRFGIKHIKQDELSYDAVLISLIDQPLIDTNHLEILITQFRNESTTIVASDLGDRVGVPAIFSSTIFDELERLEEDFGARYIIKKHIDEVKVVSAMGKSIDVDTMKQYKELIQAKFSI